MKKIFSLSQVDVQTCEEFHFGYTDYRRSEELRAYFATAFHTRLLACYRSVKGTGRPDAGRFTSSCGEFLLFFPDGSTTCLLASDWLTVAHQTPKENGRVNTVKNDAASLAYGGRSVSHTITMRNRYVTKDSSACIAEADAPQMPELPSLGFLDTPQGDKDDRQP